MCENQGLRQAQSNVAYSEDLAGIPKVRNRVSLILVLSPCHEYGGYKYPRLGKLDTSIVFESWINYDSRLTNEEIRIHIGSKRIV